MDRYARVPMGLVNDDLAPSAAKEVYLALDGYLDKKTGLCQPALEDLRRDLGFSVRWLRAMITWLEKKGWVAVQRSPGRPNRFASEPAPAPRRGYVLSRATPEVECRGSAADPGSTVPDPPEPGCRSTPEVECRGSADRTVYESKELREEGPSPSPSAHPDPRPKAEFLFAEALHKRLAFEVDFLVGENPDLAHLRPWFPELVAAHFVARNWKDKDDHSKAYGWALRIAAAKATEADVREAFAWDLAQPAIDAQGHPAFGRSWHLDRIMLRITQRRRSAPRTPEAAQVDRPITHNPIYVAWENASEAERERIRLVVRDRRPSATPGEPVFELECAMRFAQEKRGAAAVGANQ